MISAFIYKHDAASILDSNQSDIPSQCQDVEGVERDTNSASSHKASVRCVSLHSGITITYVEGNNDSNLFSF